MARPGSVVEVDGGIGIVVPRRGGEHSAGIGELPARQDVRLAVRHGDGREQAVRTAGAGVLGPSALCYLDDPVTRPEEGHLLAGIVVANAGELARLVVQGLGIAPWIDDL